MNVDMTKTKVICLLPVKNEAWILKHFIEAALAWADILIIGDHNSTDDSASIARQYDRVKLITLSNPAFDAGERRRKLLEEARKIPGKRLIFYLDADEMLSANWAESAEWDLMLNAPPGTNFQFESYFLLPGLEKAVIYPFITAFTDDGSEYMGTKINEPRIPATTGQRIWLQDIKLIHYQYIDLQRLLSRHQYYKCVDFIDAGTRPFAVCVEYQDTEIKSQGLPVVPVDEKLLKGYTWLDDFRSKRNNIEKCYWFDEEILNYFDKYGTKRFSKINIWDVNWNKKAHLLGRQRDYPDPRSSFEVWMHKFIKQHRNELAIGQAKENFVFWCWYIFLRVGTRILGW